MSALFDNSRFRSFGRALARQVLAVAPASKQGQVRQWLEKMAVAATGGQRGAPASIHRFWHTRYMQPAFNRLGFDSAADLVRQRVAEKARAADPAEVHILCVGVGEAHEERALAIELRNMGLANVQFHCIGSDAESLKRAESEVSRQALSKRFRFEHADLGRWRPRQLYTVATVSHALHRQAGMEWLLDAVADALEPGGEFLVHDVIGRNGHRLWPEARAALAPLWEDLPQELRLDRVTGNVLEQFPDIDASSDQNNGLRAADVLQELLKRFHFKLFAPYANLVMAVLGRRFGPNFNEEDDVHRNHLQQIHMRDRRGLLQGEFAPTRMVAVLSVQGSGTELMDKQLTPDSVAAWIRERRHL